MRRYLQKLILFFLPLLLMFISVFAVLGLPPLHFSNSISFNSRILELKEKKIKDVDVLALGSSMTLNNLHTETIIKQFGRKYLNVASWGQSMEETYKMIKTLNDYHRPKKLIISSGHMDFTRSTKNIQYNMINDYLKEDKFPFFQNFSLSYMLKEAYRIYNDKYSKEDYYNLKYDANGAVNFRINDFKVDDNRWKGIDIVKFKGDVLQYNYLDSISIFCKENKVKLIFVQSPFRNEYNEALGSSAKSVIKRHIAIVQSKLKNQVNNVFIDTTKEVWKDSLFVDYSHFNSNGAKKYTQYIINNL